MLDDLLAADLAVEVTHRSKRRLFGLKGVTPLRDVVRPPYRPESGQGRGRPRHDVDVKIEEPTPISPPLTPLEIRSCDYTALDERWRASTTSFGRCAAISEHWEAP
jgi:hypothetical protein